MQRQSTSIRPKVRDHDEAYDAVASGSNIYRVLLPDITKFDEARGTLQLLFQYDMSASWWADSCWRRIYHRMGNRRLSFVYKQTGLNLYPILIYCTCAIPAMRYVALRYTLHLTLKRVLGEIMQSSYSATQGLSRTRPCTLPTTRTLIASGRSNNA